MRDHEEKAKEIPDVWHRQLSVRAVSYNSHMQNPAMSPRRRSRQIPGCPPAGTAALCRSRRASTAAPPLPYYFLKSTGLPA